MKIKIIGAADSEVTGSRYSARTKHARILVDCGRVPFGRALDLGLTEGLLQ
jgi:hypothetical protein